MPKAKKPISDPVGQLREALRLFQLGNKTKAIHLVFGPSHDDYDNIDNALSSLYTETYIFFTDGDLSKKGRGFGYASTEEIRADLDRYISALNQDSA